MRAQLRLVFFCFILLTIGCGKESRNPLRGISVGIDNEMFNLVNSIRQSGTRCGSDNMPAVKPLKWSSLLVESSKKHTIDMFEGGFHSHTGSDGSSVSTRVEKAGYRWTAVGENIARGQKSAREVMEDWLESEGHCRNIMNGNFEEMGSYNHRNYWVQNFARPTRRRNLTRQ